MANVLVVDDEREYREELYMALASAGHEVMTRGNGGAAIDLGIRMRPDVLIVDWMLKDSVDGLNVCDVLRTVQPKTKIIVMTGFASRDLREQSISRSIAGFLDKPFEMAEVISAVAKAVAKNSEEKTSDESKIGAAPIQAGDVPLGVIELNHNWECVFFNPVAQKLAGIEESHVGSSILDHLKLDASLLQRSELKWVDAELLRIPKGICSIRLREWEDLDTRFLFLLDPQHADRQAHPVTNLALNQYIPRASTWKIDSHALILDPDSNERFNAVDSLRDAGCSCHGAVDVAEAIRLLKRDKKLKIAIVDAAAFGGQEKPLVEQFEEARPGVLVIGTSRGFDRDRLFQQGVKYYLQKPWEPTDLIGLLKAERSLTPGK